MATRPGQGGYSDTAHVNKMLCDAIVAAQAGSGDQRREFQKRIEDFLRADPMNFYVLGDVRYQFDPTLKASSDDWRVRDIN